MVELGIYKATVSYLAAAEQVCCENEAIAGRDTTWCDAEEEE